MKKSDLAAGICYILAGSLCLLAAYFMETKLDGLLFGFAGAGLGPGIVMLYRYHYWSAPERREAYRERLEQERIERNDELKEKLRDRAGRYAYLLGLVVLSCSMVVLSILESLELLEHAEGIILYLGGYMVLQIAAGTLFFRRLLKKYQ